jgi:dipeptidyl aminopeptidase/acylaminoacyl peptidase
MPDTHEDIRQRLFDAAWETPAFAPAAERTVARARRRAAFTIGGGAILLAAVVVTIFTLGDGTPLADQHRTGEPVRSGDPRETLVDTTTGDHSAFDVLPPGAWLYDITRDGSRIAFSAEADGRNQVWIMDMDGTGLRQLTRDPFEAIDPTWSPDGTRIVYVGFGGGHSRDLFVIDVEGGKSHKVVTEPGDPWNPRWSPDGSRILYWAWTETDDQSEVPMTTTSTEVRSVKVESGRVSVLAGGQDQRAAFEGDWDGQSGRIAFIATRSGMGSGQARHSLWLMDGDGSRKEQQLSLDADDASDTAWSPDGSQIAFIVSRHGKSYVHVFDLATGDDREIGPGEYMVWVDDGTLLMQEFFPGR